MKFKAGSSGNEDFKRVPAGNHIAVCNLIADVGLQPGSAAFPKPKYKLYIRFEIPGERLQYEKDGRKIDGPMTIGSFYTASMNEKAILRQHLESWRGRKFTDAEAEDFDVSTIIGKACMLSVVESQSGGKTYANIKSIAGLPKGMTPPKAENPLLVYGGDKRDSFNNLPEWLKDKIQKQLTPENTPDEAPPPEDIGGRDFDDSIPFAPRHWLEC